MLSLSFRNVARVKCENSILNMYYLSGGSERLTGKCRRAFSGYISREMRCQPDALMSSLEVLLSIAAVLEFKRHSSQPPLSWSLALGIRKAFIWSGEREEFKGFWTCGFVRLEAACLWGMTTAWIYTVIRLKWGCFNVDIYYFKHFPWFLFIYHSSS